MLKLWSIILLISVVSAEIIESPTTPLRRGSQSTADVNQSRPVRRNRRGIIGLHTLVDQILDIYIENSTAILSTYNDSYFRLNDINVMSNTTFLDMPLNISLSARKGRLRGATSLKRIHHTTEISEAYAETDVTFSNLSLSFENFSLVLNDKTLSGALKVQVNNQFILRYGESYVGGPPNVLLWPKKWQWKVVSFTGAGNCDNFASTLLLALLQDESFTSLNVVTLVTPALEQSVILNSGINYNII